MTITGTFGHRSTTGGNIHRPNANSWHGIALFCAVMATLLFVGAVTGGFDHPLEQDMTFAAP